MRDKSMNDPRPKMRSFSKRMNLVVILLLRDLRQSGTFLLPVILGPTLILRPNLIMAIFLDLANYVFAIIT